MWQAITQKALWRTPNEVIAHYPTAKFLTPKMANFSLAGDCAVTTQISFNAGVLIVLGITQLESQPVQSR